MRVRTGTPGRRTHDSERVWQIGDPSLEIAPNEGSGTGFECGRLGEVHQSED